MSDDKQVANHDSDGSHENEKVVAFDSSAIRGSVWYTPEVRFDIFHHHAFGYIKTNQKMGFNKNPHGDGSYIQVEDFTVLESGYSFLKGAQKLKVRCRDKTPFEKSLTNELYKLMNINNFGISDEFYTAFNGTWSLTEALSFEFISWKSGNSSDYLIIEQRDDKFGICYYTEPGMIEVSYLSLKEDDINDISLMTSQGEIRYDCSLNPHLQSFVKVFLTEGFSNYIKNNEESSGAKWTIYSDCQE